MKWEDLHKSKTVRKILISLGVIIVILAILQIGMAFGYRQAKFGRSFGDNFERNFYGPRPDIRSPFGDRMPPGGHGAIGEIVSLNLPQMIISGPDNLEKIITVNASTTARKFQENIPISDLKEGDFVVVIGQPNAEGQIEARIIRIMPEPNTQI